MADQSKHLIDQRSGNSGAKTQSLMLSEVEAAAQEFCKKILSVFQDNMPAGRTEQPQNQESSEQPQNQESSKQPQNQESSEQPHNQESSKQPFSLFLLYPHMPTTIITPETQRPMLIEAEVAAQDYLKGREHHNYLPLYLAANRGDWKSAKSFIERDPSASTARITAESLTTLMVATRACQWKFARKLLEDLPSKSLETVDLYGRTALHYTVVGGSLETTKALIRKNSELPQIPDNRGHVPLHVCPNKQLLCYLILVTRDEHPCFPFTGPLSAHFVFMLISFGYYVIHIQVANELPHSILVHMEDFQDKATSVQPSSILTRA
ncbi:hypothetical protein QYF36_012480 [Acer negundo]|nr:hypothetical protein QYF36_012480 [Acer negundo]